MHMKKSDKNRRMTTSEELILFITLTLVILSPLFLFEYFSSWDGPAHVGGAAVVSQYDDPGRSAFREYFFLNTRPLPNLLGHFLLILFQSFASPIWSEKLLIALIFVLFPLTFRYLIIALNNRAGPLAYFAFPFSIGWFVYAGQYNFSLSLPVFFLALGYWFRMRDAMNFKRMSMLSMLLLILYFSHIVSYGLFFIFVVVLALHRNILQWMKGALSFEGSLKHALRCFLPVFVASIPSAILTIFYFSSNNYTGFGDRQSFIYSLKAFGTLSSTLVVFDRMEYVFSIFVSLSLIILCLIAIYQNLAHISSLGDSGFFFVFLLVFILYFFLPDALAGGSFLSPRLSLFAHIALLCWLAQFDFRPITQRLIVIALAVSTLGLVTIRLPIITAFNRDISEFMSVAPYLRKNATVLPLLYTYDGFNIPEHEQNGVTAFARRTRPLDCVTGYLMADVGVVDLAHYESGYDYFPTQFKAELAPHIYLGTTPLWSESLPPAVDIENYYRMTTGEVDFVLVWGMHLATEEMLTDPKTILVLEQLAADYELIYTSEPRGLLQVYERKGQPHQ